MSEADVLGWVPPVGTNGWEGLKPSTPTLASKYPPAKPGALGWEPLKAAQKAAYAAYTRVNLDHAASRQIPILSRDARVSLSFPLLEPVKHDEALGPLAKPLNRQRYRRKRQTSTATPAKPGELPHG
jgi:hypothetical protein